MFQFWKRRSEGNHRDPVERFTDHEEVCVEAEDDAGCASAQPAEEEASTQTSSSRRGRSLYTPDERADIVARLASSGLSVREFAELEGVKLTTIRNWLRKQPGEGASGARSCKRFTADERRAAVEAYAKSGRKREDFARLWGCSPSSLDKWMRRYRDEGPKGLETRKHERTSRAPHPARFSEAVRAQIVALREEHQDFGVTRIADHAKRFLGLKISVSSVRNILRERGR